MILAGHEVTAPVVETMVVVVVVVVVGAIVANDTSQNTPVNPGWQPYIFLFKVISNRN